MENHGVYIFLLLIGSFLMGAGGWDLHKTRRFLEIGHIVDGKVLELIEIKDSEGQVSHTPLFTYHDRNGESRTFQQNCFPDLRFYKVGEKVQVLYDPDHQFEPRVVSYWGMHRIAILAFSAALPMLLIGSGYFFFEYIPQ